MLRSHTGHTSPHRLSVGGDNVQIHLIRGRTLSKIGLYALMILLALFGPTLGTHHDRSAMGSLPLLFHTIAIDPGHGGVDPGAVKGGVSEKEIDLAVAQEIARLMHQAGARVVMTRWKDQDHGSSNRMATRKREDFAVRRDLIDASGAEILLSIHANSFPMPSCEGPQTFYDADFEESKKLATTIQSVLNQSIPGSRRLAKPLDHYIIQTADIPAATIELGFMSNGRELQRLITGAYQSQLAFAVYTGVLEYLNQGASGTPVPDQPS